MKMKVIIASVILAAVSVAGATWLAFQSNQPETRTEEPEYTTVLPKTSTIEELGGWTKVSPEGNDPVFAYADTIGDVSISVSQQPIPKPFQIEETAKNFNATEELESNGTKVYLGTSAKGPQSVIFVKNNLLILIKSQSTISNQSWIDYVSSLN